MVVLGEPLVKPETPWFALGQGALVSGVKG
jgi:hypothetical protein